MKNYYRWRSKAFFRHRSIDSRYEFQDEVLHIKKK